MTPKEFDRLVEECMDVIPPRFRRRLENVVFVVEPEPPRPGLLGLYEGRPLTERSVSDPVRMPDRIIIYQGPHERAARNEEDLRRLVRETIWHEVAHFFGMNERQVLRAELRRRRLLDRLRRR
ncbi:MAG: metallopeptidase family protein [Bryobacteraceae bacterium]|nr:metallopeptidase family protein [Bryobacteraceae bacterium]